MLGLLRKLFGKKAEEAKTPEVPYKVEAPTPEPVVVETKPVVVETTPVVVETTPVVEVAAQPAKKTKGKKPAAAKKPSTGKKPGRKPKAQKA